MRRDSSVQTVLVRTTMLTLGAMFSVLLVLLFVMSAVAIRTSTTATTRSIRAATRAQGRTLVTNNSLALREHVEGNAFSAVFDLVKSTVESDADILYGVYQEANGNAWVETNYARFVPTRTEGSPLTDPLSRWAGGCDSATDITWQYEGSDIIEFAAPVVCFGKKKGTIRYGYSTSSMLALIDDAKRRGVLGLVTAVLVFILVGSGLLYVGNHVVRRLAARITGPIERLTESSRHIADGNYDTEAPVEGSNEIATLGRNFEAMRATIREHTHHLQDLVEAKMRQVSDILNNIDQGLFTLDLTGVASEEHSARATEILQVPRIAGATASELFRLDAAAAKSFALWLELVRTAHARLRWERIAALAPVKSLTLPAASANGPQRHIELGFQRIADADGALTKVMVLARDVTEEQLRQQEALLERERHERDVRMILSIANTPPDEMAEFLEDSSERLSRARYAAGMGAVLGSASEQVPASGNMADCFRELHTIKGNAGTYGFDLLESHAHVAEDTVEAIRSSADTDGESVARLAASLDAMETALTEIAGQRNLITGGEAHATVRLPEVHVNRIATLSSEFRRTRAQEALDALLEECRVLTWKPLRAVARKYHKAAARTARMQHKDIDFNISPEHLYVPADWFADIDEVLVHLVRNAVAHGIEPPGVREELGKAPGQVTLACDTTGPEPIVQVEDDGRGINADAVAASAVRAGMVSQDRVGAMSYDEKCELMFLSGVSTADAVSGVSGRGVGLDIVRKKLAGIGARISMTSSPGCGTTFRIHLGRGYRAEDRPYRATESAKGPSSERPDDTTVPPGGQKHPAGYQTPGEMPEPGATRKTHMGNTPA